MEKIKKFIAPISNKITSITHVFGILAMAIGALLLIYDVRYLLSFGGGWDYINNIIVEAHGLFFDLLVLGVLISIYERKRQRKEAIERDENLIDDFRGWDEKEAMYRIVGAAKRLNKLGASKMKLYGCFLAGANLSRAKLFMADLAFTDLSESNLSGIDFTEADLSYANLMGADLTGANLTGAYLFKANLQGATLEKAVFKSANLNEAKIGGANLSNADLSNANLSGANLSSAGLIGAKFHEANLRDTNLLHADVEIDWFEKIEKWEALGYETITSSYFIHPSEGLQQKKQSDL